MENKSFTFVSLSHESNYVDVLEKLFLDHPKTKNYNKFASRVPRIVYKYFILIFNVIILNRIKPTA